MKRVLSLILVIGAVVLLTSCYEYAEEYTFNKDGSGSFSMDIGMGSMIASMMDLGESMGDAVGGETGADEAAPEEGEAADVGESAPAEGEAAEAPADGADPPTEGVTVAPEADATGGDVEGDGNPFKDMKAAADRINKEGDPNGIITSAEFKQFDEGDMKHSVFTVKVKDMTKAIDAVKSDWWAGAPGAVVEGTTATPPFTIEKLKNGNLLFTKEIAVPDSSGNIPYPEGEGKGEAADGDEAKPDEGGAVDGDETKPDEGGDVLGMLGLSTAAYAQEDTGAEETGGTDMETGGAVDGESGDPNMDINMEDMMAQAFAGKFYTITLNAPKIVSSNGEDITPAAAEGGAKPEFETVQWKIPMGDLMGSTGYYLKCTAEIKQREKNPIKRLTNIVTGQTEEGADSSVIWMSVIVVIVVLVLIIVLARAGRRRVKKA